MRRYSLFCIALPLVLSISSAWGWRMETKSTDYAKVVRVKIGFG